MMLKHVVSFPDESVEYNYGTLPEIYEILRYGNDGFIISVVSAIDSRVGSDVGGDVKICIDV